MFERSSAADADKTSKDKDTKKGKVKDFAVATSDGKVTGIAISVGDLGGRTILVPAANLTCSIVDKKPVYSVRMTKAELDGHPEFDAKKAENAGLDQEGERIRGLPGRMKGPKASPEPGVPREGRTHGRDGLRPRHADQGLRDQRGDKHFGKVRDATVDFAATRSPTSWSPRRRRRRRHPVYLVPFNAAMWGRDGDKMV